MYRSKTPNNLENSFCSLKIENEWLTTKKAAEYLGVSTGSIYNRAYRGQLPYTKYQSRNYFKRSELNKLIESSIQGGLNGY